MNVEAYALFGLGESPLVHHPQFRGGVPQLSSLDGLGGCYTNCGYIGESSNWLGYQTLTLSVGVQITSPLPVSPKNRYRILVGLG